MKGIILIISILTLFTSSSYGQAKEYYQDHHALSLQYSARIRGTQVNYRYILNPKSKFMWIPKAGVGYSRLQYPPVYYNAGIDVAYGGKNRIFLGVGGYYNAASYKSRFIAGDIGYLLLGKKHIFFSTTFRVYYDPYCNCPDFSPFFLDLLVSLGWNF